MDQQQEWRDLNDNMLVIVHVYESQVQGQRINLFALY